MLDKVNLSFSGFFFKIARLKISSIGEKNKKLNFHNVTQYLVCFFVDY